MKTGLWTIGWILFLSASFAGILHVIVPDNGIPFATTVVTRQNLPLGATQEKRFQQWYAGKAQQYGLNPNPDDFLHYYDYRGAFLAGADAEVSLEDGLPHWPSEFKLEGHPSLIVDGVDTRTNPDN